MPCRRAARTSRSARLQEKAADDKRRDALIVGQGLDHVFDGNWQGDAGQFLLRWYTHSTCDARLVLVTQDGIVLAAPPVHAVMDREKHMKVVTRLAPGKSNLVDPYHHQQLTFLARKFSPRR